MHPETLAVLLHTALKDIQSRSSQTNFYDPRTKQSFEIQSTLELLNKHYPKFTIYEQETS